MPEAATVSCGQMPQYCKSYENEIIYFILSLMPCMMSTFIKHSSSSSSLLVAAAAAAEAVAIAAEAVAIAAAGPSRQTLPQFVVTTYDTVHCGQRPQHLKGHSVKIS